MKNAFNEQNTRAHKLMAMGKIEKPSAPTKTPVSAKKSGRGK